MPSRIPLIMVSLEKEYIINNYDGSEGVRQAMEAARY